jgi:hypothetical protein
MEFNVHIVGTRPLLMHNIAMASKTNTFARQISAITRKPASTKTDEDYEHLARLDWEGGMYFDPDIGPYIPAANIFQSFVVGAKALRLGTTIDKAMEILDDLYIPLLYEGPRTIDEMWTSGQFVDTRMVGIGKKRIERTRPVFRHWGLEVHLGIDTSIIDLENFHRVADLAGTAGLGDYRRFFGRYQVKLEESAT